MRRFRELTDPEERHRAAIMAESWGYPRPISGWEHAGSAWVHFGPDVIFWLQWIPPGSTELALHIAMHPESRGKIPPAEVQRWQTGVGVIAELAGAERVVANLPRPEQEPLRRHLQKLGWEACSGGMTLGLGEE